MVFVWCEDQGQFFKKKGDREEGEERNLVDARTVSDPPLVEEEHLLVARELGDISGGALDLVQRRLTDLKVDVDS